MLIVLVIHFKMIFPLMRLMPLAPAPLVQTMIALMLVLCFLQLSRFFGLLQTFDHVLIKSIIIEQLIKFLPICEMPS